MNLSTSLLYKKNILLSGYQLQYVATSSLVPGELSSFASLFLKQMYPHLLTAFTDQKLVNFKGRAPLCQLIPDLPVPQEDELLFIQGDIAVQGNLNEIVWEPFYSSVNTSLIEFRGYSEAIYACSVHTSREAADTVPIHLMADAVTVQLRGFRFGLEHFRPTRRKFSFGYTPAVEETLLIDATQEQFRLELNVDGSSRKVINPITDISTFGLAFDLLTKMTHFPWRSDFSGKLAAHSPGIIHRKSE